MSTVIAINGSPRKKGNTATLLTKALEGAAGTGAETELIHLYDLNYKGCLSCFACKRKNGKNFGRCVVKDGLTPVLEKITKARAVIFGSPIYIADVTGELRSCLERLVFPNVSYDDWSTYFTGSLNIGFIYTMNMDKDEMREDNYDVLFAMHSRLSGWFGGRFEYIVSNETWQFDDYSLYAAAGFDEEHKAKVREEIFPKDCERAESMGAALASS